MFGEQRTRTLLGPADPARDTPVAPTRLSARDLIARAGSMEAPIAGRTRARPTRRLVLVAGAAAAVTGAAMGANAFGRSGRSGSGTTSPPGAEAGVVLVPVAYQFDRDAPAAGDQLRALAARLTDAPYDSATGRYMYHHKRTWGDPRFGDGEHWAAWVGETKVWQAADGTGEQISTQLEVQYPNQRSREYWQRIMTETDIPGPATLSLPPTELASLPSDRAGLSKLLKVHLGGGAASKEVGTVYGRYVVPRAARAEILRTLADIPGFLWRGEVTDRAGRKGVAITFDDRAHDVQFLLIFDPSTGELRATEMLRPAPEEVRVYILILATDWTDRIGER